MPSLYDAAQRISLGTHSDADFIRLLEDVLRRVALKHYEWLRDLGYDANQGDESSEGFKTHSDAAHMLLEFLLSHSKSGQAPLQKAVLVAGKSGESAKAKDKILKDYLWKCCRHHLSHLGKKSIKTSELGNLVVEDAGGEKKSGHLNSEDITRLADELLERLS
jgi:hypothetical protein